MDLTMWFAYRDVNKFLQVDVFFDISNLIRLIGIVWKKISGEVERLMTVARNKSRKNDEKISQTREKS